MEITPEEEKLLAIMDAYVHAFESADPDQVASLFWLDDPRFIEVENHIGEPFGRERFVGILKWMREHQRPGWKMRFHDTAVHVLTPEVAYTVSLRETEQDGELEHSRVTLIYLKKDDEWRIIHGHFSYAPD